MGFWNVNPNVFEWNHGDVYAYRLGSNLARGKGLWGKYFLMQKIDEIQLQSNRIAPIVYVKITSDTTLPSNVDKYNQLEYVQTWFTKYEERFYPVNMSCQQEDIAKKAKQDYQVDAYGFLPQYRIMLLDLSPQMVISHFSYVGNFADAEPPQKEFIPHDNINIVAVSLRKSCEAFESKLILRYCGHNLRELSIYNKTGDG